MLEFPTGKAHVSYSEVKAWSECSYRHKLMYVDKIQTYEDNPYADFGTVVHNEIENFLNGQQISVKNVQMQLDQIWEEKKYDSAEYIEKIRTARAEIGSRYVHENLDTWKTSAENILHDLPTFLDEQFPGWEPFRAEQELYEEIGISDLKFKGFIDCIIKVPSPRSKSKKNYWLLDWKTTGKGGWYFTKRKEFISLAQVGSYKKYWSENATIPLKDIRTGYVFLKRGAKKGKTCELFKVSTGPKFIEKADKLVSNMIRNVEKRFTLKNYNNCKFCPFKGTEHCDGKGW